MKNIHQMQVFFHPKKIIAKYFRKWFPPNNFSSNIIMHFSDANGSQ
jgi:hypothetical protein